MHVMSKARTFCGYKSTKRSCFRSREINSVIFLSQLSSTRSRPLTARGDGRPKARENKRTKLLKGQSATREPADVEAADGEVGTKRKQA